MKKYEQIFVYRSRNQFQKCYDGSMSTKNGFLFFLFLPLTLTIKLNKFNESNLILNFVNFD